MPSSMADSMSSRRLLPAKRAIPAATMGHGHAGFTTGGYDCGKILVLHQRHGGVESATVGKACGGQYQPALDCNSDPDYQNRAIGYINGPPF